LENPIVGGIFTFRYSTIYNMKKLILSIFVAIAAMMSASAQYASAPEVFANNPDQVVPGLKYRKLKKLYNPKDYVYLADPEYGTSRAWFNVLVPGLAQFTMKEPGRGVRFLAIGLVTDAIASAAASYYIYEDSDDESALYSALGFGALSLGNFIWSIVDAKRIAKVKSLYDYDLKKLGRQVSFETMPFVAPVRIGDKVQPAAGVTFAMQF